MTEHDSVLQRRKQAHLHYVNQVCLKCQMTLNMTIQLNLQTVYTCVNDVGLLH